MRSLIKILTLLNMVMLSQATAQTFRGIPVHYRDSQLPNTFRYYQVFKLPTDSISAYVHEHRVSAPLTLIMGDQEYTWTLYENQMLRPDVKGTTFRNGAYTAFAIDMACRTYIGFSPLKEKGARFTITNHNFAAMIPEDETFIFIQPLYHFITSADKNLFVQYRLTDVKKGQMGRCDAFSKALSKSTPSIKSEIENKKYQLAARTFDCREFEVAFATDHRMWIEYFTEDNIIDYALSVINFMEPFFDDFDFDFWVQDFFIVNSANQDDTPWGISLDMDDLKDDFEDWADAYFGEQDIGHLWTAGNIYTSEGNGILGRADIGGACGDIGITPWTVLENNVLTDLYELALLQAHEYGHLLDAEHVEGGGTIMEPNFGNIESATWHVNTIDEINSFIVDEPCLQSCIQCPTSYNIIDYIGWGDWRYSALVNISSTAVIDSIADVIYQANQYIRLTPGFSASSLQPASEGSTFVAKIAGCE